MWMLSKMSTFERFDFREMERLIWVFGRSVGGLREEGGDDEDEEAEA